MGTASHLRVVEDVDSGYWTAGKREVRRAVLPASRYLDDAWAVAEALFAREGTTPDLDELTWLCAELDDFMARIGTRSRLLLRACLWACSWVAPVLDGKIPPLRLHSADHRARALERMERSPLAMPVLGVKVALSILWYEHPRAAEAIGFDGRCRGTAK